MLKKIILYTSFKILAPLASKKIKNISTMLNFKIPSREAVTIIYTNDGEKNRRRIRLVYD